MTKNWTINSMPLSPVPHGPIYTAIYYKEALSNSYLFVANNIQINPDGTVPNGPTITIDTNIIYDIQAVNQVCTSNVYTESISFPCANTCPPGWLLSSDGTYCYTNTSTPATPPSGGNAALAVSVTDASYSTCPTAIFDPGFNVNGTGTFTPISTSNTFWTNGGTCVDNLTTLGPLNRCGIWISTVESNQTVGFSQCLDLEEDAIYYVGVGADNNVIINLDGVNILTQDPVAMETTFPAAGPNAAPFKVWCIYPVSVQAGSHTLEMIGFNVSGAAAFGSEIYLNTPSEISAATDYTGLNLIFSTKNLVGQPIEIGSGGFGYTCPTGYSLQTCSSPFLCVKQMTQDPTC